MARSVPLLLVAFSPLLLAQPAAKDPEARIRGAIAGFKGTVSLFAKNLQSGKTFGIRETEKVRTASTIKLPILVALFAAAEAGKVSWTERLPMMDRDKVSGSGVMREFAGDQRFLIRDLANLMIVVSDNTATNLILDRLTTDFVNAEMDKLGLPATRSMRKILGDGKALKPEPEGMSKAGMEPDNKRFGIGSTTPAEMVALLEGLHAGKVVSPDASRRILEIMRRQQFKDGIGRAVPDEWVASKSGALDALRSDVGIVTPGKRDPIAIAITVDGMPRIDYSPDNAGNKLISLITGHLLQMLR